MGCLALTYQEEVSSLRIIYKSDKPKVLEENANFFRGVLEKKVCAEKKGANSYRYGFNGKELDPEGMGGGGSTYDYGFRIYNPQIARFLSVDPLSPEYPWYTPYQFAGNKPIVAIDLDGLEEHFVFNSLQQTGTVLKLLDVVENELAFAVLYYSMHNKFVGDDGELSNWLPERLEADGKTPAGFTSSHAGGYVPGPKDVNGESSHLIILYGTFENEDGTFNQKEIGQIPDESGLLASDFNERLGRIADALYEAERNNGADLGAGVKANWLQFFSNQEEKNDAGKGGKGIMEEGIGYDPDNFSQPFYMFEPHLDTMHSDEYIKGGELLGGWRDYTIVTDSATSLGIRYLNGGEVNKNKSAHDYKEVKTSTLPNK